MAIKEYQRALALSTLYKVTKKGGTSGSEMLAPTIWVDTGSVDIYGHSGATQPAAIADMSLSADDTALEGTIKLSALPTYILVAQNTGITTELVATGIEIEDLGVLV